VNCRYVALLAIAFMPITAALWLIAKSLPRSLTFHLRCAVEQLACGTAQWQSSPRLGSATDKITHSLSRVSGELLGRATNHGGLKTDGASGMNPRRGSPFFIVLQPYPRWRSVSVSPPQKKSAQALVCVAIN
jgi:hypothetical protein